MARPPADGRSERLSPPVYFRIRQEHHRVVKRIQEEDEREITWIVRRCFERGFEQLYGDKLRQRATAKKA